MPISSGVVSEEAENWADGVEAVPRPFLSGTGSQTVDHVQFAQFGSAGLPAPLQHR